MTTDRSPATGPISRLLALSANERAACAWSFTCFFSILCAYFLLRPIRDEMAIRAGPENIPNLFLGTFVAVLLLIPVFGWITKHVPRRRFMPAIFAFCALNLLVFFWLFGNSDIDQIWVARGFFVWLSVFNMFVVSLFWSFMADLYDKDQARRVFGLIAAGGSTGAICGPLLTAILVNQIGIRELLILASCLLLLTIVSIYQLLKWAAKNSHDEHSVNDPKPIGGSVLEGIWLVLKTPYLLGIGAMILLATFGGTAMYLYQAELFSTYIPDPRDRTQLLASMDAAINIFTLILQIGVARHAIKHLGIGFTLTIMPMISIIGFVSVALAPSVAVVVAFQVLRRSSGFGLNGPAKETLFSVVPPEAKYKAKNFLDLTLVRAADVVSSQAVRLLQLFGVAFAPIAVLCATFSAIWIGVSLALGRKYQSLYQQLSTQQTGDES